MGINRKRIISEISCKKEVTSSLIVNTTSYLFAFYCVFSF